MFLNVKMDSVLFERTFRTCAREPRARYMPRWWEAAWNDASGSTAYTVALFMITRTKHSKTIWHHSPRFVLSLSACSIFVTVVCKGLAGKRIPTNPSVSTQIHMQYRFSSRQCGSRKILQMLEQNFFFQWGIFMMEIILLLYISRQADEMQHCRDIHATTATTTAYKGATWANDVHWRCCVKK